MFIGEMATPNRSEFVVNLVSNASTDVYPNNVISSFTTQLPGNGIHLEDTTGNGNNGSWEVALLEISYPAKFHNVVNGKYTYNSDYLRDNDNPFELEVPKGQYNTVSEILRIMAAQVKQIYTKYHDGSILTRYAWELSQYEPFEYTLDELSGVLSIKLNSRYARITLLSTDLRVILGMPYIIDPDVPHHIVTGTIVDASKWTKADYPVDIQKLHSVMIYTDIIEHQIIGDTLAPLLRVVPIITKYRGGSIFELNMVQPSLLRHTFTSPLQFKRLEKKSFHSISIDLYGENGEKIPFVGVGRCSLSLLFRYNRFV